MVGGGRAEIHELVVLGLRDRYDSFRAAARKGFFERVRGVIVVIPLPGSHRTAIFDGSKTKALSRRSIRYGVEHVPGQGL
jgi:hypothetical protein